MVTKEVARRWRDVIGGDLPDRRVKLNADGDVVDVETGEVVGALLLKALYNQQTNEPTQRAKVRN